MVTYRNVPRGRFFGIARIHEVGRGGEGEALERAEAENPAPETMHAQAENPAPDATRPTAEELSAGARLASPTRRFIQGRPASSVSGHDER